MVNTNGGPILRKLKWRNFLSVLSFLGITSLASVLAHADTATLDKEISTLSKDVAALGVDQAAAIHYLMQISNLSNGALLTAPVVNANPGGTVDLPISLIPSTFFPSSLQATLLLPSGITLTSITAGPAAIAATKQVSSNGTIFILFGLNQNPINAGVVVIAHLSVSATAVKTFYPISIVSPVFADGNGKAVVATTTSGTVIVQ